MLETPCERLRWGLLSALRRAIVKGLIDKGISRKQVAIIFEISEAAISYYLHDKRGTQYVIDKKNEEKLREITDKLYKRVEIMSKAGDTPENLDKIRGFLINSLCYMCNSIRKENIDDSCRCRNYSKA